MATPNPAAPDQPGTTTPADNKAPARQPRPDDIKGVTDAEIDAALSPDDAGGKKGTPAPGAEGVDDELVDDGKGGKRHRTHAERRASQRSAAAADKQRIAELEAQNQELAQRVSRVEGRTVQSDRARLQENLLGAAARVSAAREAKRAAREANDAGAEEAAEEALYIARRQHETLQAIQARVEAGDREAQAQAAAPRGPAIDPEVQRLAGGWIRKNDWYDPQLRDEDSRVAWIVDDGVKKDGYDPRTPEYYAELDKRMAKRLPHLFTDGDGSGRRSADADLDDDDAAGAGGAQVRKGGSPTGGSSRESGAGASGTIKVPPDFIKAARDAGLDWDDPDTRKRLTARYIAERKAIAEESKARGR